jgi:rhodanese-related sulfurtransferase
VTISEISVQDLAAIGSTARVIDVREQHEWESGHIAHAEHLPLGAVPDRVHEFDGTPTYIVCRSGSRSGRACEYLDAAGVDVVNVAGGMLAWAGAGFDVATGAGSGVAGD